ncbi:MAG: YfhO family protein, partial [Thermomicrobiales bacterium]
TATVAWQRFGIWSGLAHLDVGAFYLPWYAFLGEHVRHLQIPGWNPHQFSGTPFAGDPQSGWGYLPAMVFFALLPPVAAYAWFLIFHLLLAGVSAYALGRALGMRVHGALALAAAYEFGPLLNHITCCLIHVQLAAWIPTALLGIELAVRVRGRLARAAACCLSGFAVSQMLAGWVGQGAYNGLLLVDSYVLYRTLLSPPHGGSMRRRTLAAASTGGVVFAAAFGLAAVGLLPRLAAVAETNVAGGEYTGTGTVDYALGWTFPQLLDRLFSDGRDYFSAVYYLGGAAIALAILAPALARRRHAVPYFTCLAVVTSTLTLERITPLHRLFYLLPRFEPLHEHVPMRVVAVLWIGIAVLAGATVDALALGVAARSLRRAGAAVLLVWGGVVLYVRTRDFGIGAPTLAAVAAVCLLLAILSIAPRIAGRLRGCDERALRGVLALLLVALIVWEPAGRIASEAVLNGREDVITALPTGPATHAAVAANAAATDPVGAGGYLRRATAGAEAWRYFGYDDALRRGGGNWPTNYRDRYFQPEAQALLVNARAMTLKLDDVQGYNPVQLTRYVAFLNALNGASQNYHDAQILPGGLDSPLLDLLNVRYIVIPDGGPPGRPRPDLLRLIRSDREVFHDGAVRVLENPNALPRAWIVHRAVADGSGRQQLDQLATGAVDPKKVALIDRPLQGPALTRPTGTTAESVTVAERGSDHVGLDALLAADGFVVLSETYASGWHAYLDGEPVPIYLTDGLLRGVAAPAGAHRIDFRYEPASLRLGLWISLASLLLVAIVGAGAVRERRRSRRISA